MYLTEGQCLSGIQSQFTSKTPTFWPQPHNNANSMQIYRDLFEAIFFVSSLSLPSHGVAGPFMDPHFLRAVLILLRTHE
jgi:hypothetical protein